MFVACSTLCFGRLSLEEALGIIAELEFSKFEAALHEQGCQLRPSEIADDIGPAAARLRHGPGLTPVAFSVEIDADDPKEYDRQLKAVCRLARISAVPLITLKAAAVDTPLDEEIERLGHLVRLAAADGVQATVSTRIGTLTEDPEVALSLCQRVRGLYLTLDPSHYIAGPHADKNHDALYPYVKHVHLRDTGRGPNQFQVRVGQGEVEYGRIIAQLARYQYDRILSVDIHDVADAPFAMQPEVRKLKYLLESLV
ncbi:MAG TPA: sugar phosphate isomerase/epimerase [Gemmataceae bacterium]|nr:sugar phosphate isomerase/epimerase [Gemmataceae bacterium]